MSLLSVDKLSHTFGDRTLFKDVSFRLLAEDHVGLSWCKRGWKINFNEYYYKAINS